MLYGMYAIDSEVYAPDVTCAILCEQILML